MATEKLFEQDPSLQAGQRRTQAEVLAEPERQVRVRGSSDHEVVGVGAKDIFVAVRRSVELDDDVASANGPPPQLDIGGGDTHHVGDRGGPAEHFLDRGRNR
jgi:hypothetical protein